MLTSFVVQLQTNAFKSPGFFLLIPQGHGTERQGEAVSVSLNFQQCFQAAEIAP